MIKEIFSKKNLGDRALRAIFLSLALSVNHANAADIAPFIGDYSGSATLDNNGTTISRDMSVQIRENKEGFTVTWESIVHKPSGRKKKKSYSIDFIPTHREHIYSSAMKTNVFGHAVPLDPMVGDPYVWARIAGNVLTVFSLHVDEEGSYEMQEYNRTLVDGGLNLDYQSVRNGEILNSISTFLRME